MKNECSIIKDLLPLYAENMVSDETASFVEEHLKSCAECRKEYEKIKEPETVTNEADAVPLINLERKLKKKKIQTIAFTAVVVAALLVSVFAVLSSPEFFPYRDGLLSMTENADKSVTVTFDEKVTDYSCQSYLDPNDSGQIFYQIEAWTSLWDKMFSNRGVRSVTVMPKDDLSLSVYYSSNNGEPDLCVYGQPTEDGGVISLPRLTLGYYLIFAVAVFVLSVILRLVFRHKEGVKKWIGRILLYSVSYISGHLIVLGFKTVSYSAQRDFVLIVCISVLIFFGLYLALGIYRRHKESQSATDNR